MAKTTHKSDAPQRIDEYIASLPDWSRRICEKLRDITLKSDPKIIEDWKWGPNYYLEGMVCGFAAFKKHVNFVFFKGTQLKDKKKLLQGEESSLNIRSFRFKDVKEIDEEIVLEYLFEAIDNNKNGLKLIKSTNKEVIIPPEIKKQFKKAGVLDFFEQYSYSYKKAYIIQIEQAKKAETRINRIEKIILMLKKNRAEKATKTIFVKEKKKL